MGLSLMQTLGFPIVNQLLQGGKSGLQDLSYDFSNRKQNAEEFYSSLEPLIKSNPELLQDPAFQDLVKGYAEKQGYFTGSSIQEMFNSRLNNKKELDQLNVIPNANNMQKPPLNSSSGSQLNALTQFKNLGGM